MVGQKSTKAQSVFFHIFSCVLGFIMVYPLLWLLMSSFKSNDTMFHNAWSLIPEKWDILTNYLSGWKGIAGIPFWRFTLNSVIVTVVSVAGTIFCSLLAAYAVSRLKFKGANFWFGCIVMTMMIPSQVMVVKLYTDPNSYNNYGGLFAMSVLSLLPVIIVFILFQKYIVEGIATDGIKG